MRLIHILMPGLVWAMGCARASAAPPASALAQVADVALPGGSTRFDYQSLDPKTGMLYLSHMGDGELLAFDTRSRTVTGRLAGLPNVTGVLAVSSLGKVYCSVPGDRTVAVVDERAFKKVASLPAEGFADGLAFAPGAGKVFVSDEDGGREMVIDAKTDRVLGRVELGGETGNTQYDPGSSHILANVQSTGEMVELDPGSGELLGRHHLEGGRRPHGLLVDSDDRLAFVACEADAKLLVVDLRDFKVTQVLGTGDGPDVLAMDPGLGRLYVACEGGVLSIFSRRGRGLIKMEDAKPGGHCHSVCVDPASHLVYLPLKNVGGRPILRIMRPSGS